MKYNTDRIELIPLDIDLLYEPPYIDWMMDKEVNKYNSHGIFPLTPKKTEDFIQSINNKEIIVWSIWINKDIWVGNISLQFFDWINRSAELAILLGNKEYWGKGIGTEASKVVLYHGFRKLNMNRIWLGTSEANIGMIKIAENIGMTKEGISKEALFYDGVYRDIVHYGILKKEYKGVYLENEFQSN